MKPFTREDLRTLLSEQQAPCITVWLPMQRAQNAAHENQLRFKNALRSAETALAQTPAYKAAGPALIDRLQSLDTPDFWAQQRDSLAIYCNADALHWWRFPETTAETVTVADTFLTKPLVKYLQGDVRYYILTLTKENISVLEGNHDTLDPVRVTGMPRGMRDLETSKQQPGTAVRTTSVHGGVHYGAGGGEIDGKEDLRMLFRLVDKALLTLTHDERTPLILATFDQYHGLFHEVSKNPALLDERIEGDPAKMTLTQLRDGAMAILAPRRTAAMAAQAEQYQVALARKRGTNYLPNIARAAVQGRVQTLLIEDGRAIRGNLDRATGEVSGMSLSGAGTSPDLLDDVAELVLAAGGNVYVLPKNLMPTDVGAAAIYRY